MVHEVTMNDPDGGEALCCDAQLRSERSRSRTIKVATAALEDGMSHLEALQSIKGGSSRSDG